MENLDVGEFNPKKEELVQRVLESSKIIVSDLRDLKQIGAVKESRLSLRKDEIQIEKDGKKYREKARDIINYVLGKEKELKAITSPEIERLKEIEDKSEAVLLKDRRLKGLLDKKKRLEEIGDNVKVEDDYLLGLDDLEFVTYLNERVANKNEADKIAEENRAKMARAKVQAEQEAQAKKLEEEREALRIKEDELEAKAEKKRKEEQDKIDKANEEIERKKQEAQDKIDKANEDLAQKNKEAQDKIDEANRKIEADKLDLQHKKELQEADDRAKKDAEEKQEADKLKAIEDKKEEDKKLAKRKAYIDFLSENGYTEKMKDDFTTKDIGNKRVLYKKVGEFEL